MDNHMTLGQALAVLRPGAQWALRGDTLDGLEWLDEQQVAPSQEEIDAQLAKLRVPETVTPRQARIALLSAGLLDKAQAAVDAAGGATKITWEYATEFSRVEPLIDAIGQQLGLSDEQIDALFVYASKQ